MRIKYLLAIVSVTFLYTTAWSQTDWTSHYKIYHTKSRKIITIDELVSFAENADVLFFGEEHNDSIAHRLQDTLYVSLLNRYKTVTLSMEMFETDCQQIVDEYLSDFITDERLVKEARAWANYKDYRPMVNTAKQWKQRIIAANAPRRYVNMISRRGLASLDSLPKNAKQYFARLPIDTVNKPYFEKFSKLMGASRQTSGYNIYYAQTMWDATMAQSIYRYWKKNKGKKIFHLIGRFHTDNRFGTYTQLQRKTEKIKIQNISCFSASDFNNPDWSNYEAQGDYIIITNPDVPRSYK